MIDQNQPGERRAVQIENARVWYQAAVELWAHQDAISWSLFNALLVLHAGVIAGVVLLMTTGGPRTLMWLSVGLPVFGIVVGMVSKPMLGRGLAYQQYWTLAAAGLEWSYLRPAVTTVMRGEEFAESRGR